MIRLALQTLLTLIALSSAALGQAQPFASGDRVCFLGDSIFHGGKVHSDLLLFYATRYPHSPVVFYNAGVAGDMATEAQRRIDWDICPSRPSVTVIMFGMNDVGRWLYGPGTDSSANLQQRKRMLDAHILAMDKLVGQLKADGSRIIICTPTPYDQSSQRPTANATGVDDALGQVADNASRIAREGGYGLVDFHGQMDRIMAARQAKDPAFTMMDDARVHPNDAGHLLMTYIFLKAQDMKPTVSRIVLDAQAGQPLVAAENCAVTGINSTPGSLSFQCLADALPYPVGEEENAVLEWVPFTDDLNQETLQVRHLTPGNYNVQIDAQPIGAYTSAYLEKGINLATNTATPQYKQASAAMAFNETRRSRENGTLRVFAALEHDVLRPKGIDTTDMAAVRAAMDAAIAEEGRNKTWKHDYFVALSKAYYAEKPNQKAIEKELADMTTRLFQMCIPHAHQYEIRPQTPSLARVGFLVRALGGYGGHAGDSSS